MKRYTLLVLSTVSTFSFAQQSLHPELDSVAIVGAKIETEPGSVLENATVITERGVITYVGPTTTLPPGCEKIDGKGLFVYAGFIDLAATKGMKPFEAPANLDVQETTSQDVATQMAWTGTYIHAQYNAGEQYLPTDGVWTGYRMAGFTNTLLLPSDGVVCGQASFVHLDTLSSRVSVMRQNVGQVFSTSIAGRFGGSYPGTALGCFAVIRQAISDAGWFGSQNSDAAAADASMRALYSDLSNKKRSFIRAGSTAQIQNTLALVKELKLDNVLVGCSEAYKVPELPRDVNMILSMEFKPEPMPSDAKDLPKDPTQLAKRKEMQRLWLETVNNAKFVAGNGNVYALSGFDAPSPDIFWNHIRRAMKVGLSHNQVLAGLTTNPALILRAGKSLGKVAKGFAANLTVLTGDFSDAKSKTKWLVINGQKIDPNAKPYQPVTPRPFFEEGGLR